MLRVHAYRTLHCHLSLADVLGHAGHVGGVHRVVLRGGPDEAAFHRHDLPLGVLLPLESALVVFVEGVLLQHFDGVLSHLGLILKEFVQPLQSFIFVLVDAHTQILVPVCLEAL